MVGIVRIHRPLLDGRHDLTNLVEHLGDEGGLAATVASQGLANLLEWEHCEGRLDPAATGPAEADRGGLFQT